MPTECMPNYQFQLTPIINNKFSKRANPAPAPAIPFTKSKLLASSSLAPRGLHLHVEQFMGNGVLRIELCFLGDLDEADV